jgi:hypothetical protein
MSQICKDLNVLITPHQQGMQHSSPIQPTITHLLWIFGSFSSPASTNIMTVPLIPPPLTFPHRWIPPMDGKYLWMGIVYGK